MKKSVPAVMINGLPRVWLVRAENGVLNDMLRPGYNYLLPPAGDESEKESG